MSNKRRKAGMNNKRSRYRYIPCGILLLHSPVFTVEQFTTCLGYHAQYTREVCVSTTMIDLRHVVRGVSMVRFSI